MRYIEPMVLRVVAGLLACCVTVAAQDESIHIVVLEGDGAINNIRSSRAKEPVVRVEDAGKRGVPQAVVTFLLPSTGPGATFGDGGASLTLITDDRGEAVARGLHPNRSPGAFQIRVTASWRGQTAAASLSQTNVDPGAHTSSRKIAILALIGGGAAGGAALALRGGKSKSTSPNPTGTVVLPGTPTLGGPQ